MTEPAKKASAAETLWKLQELDDKIEVTRAKLRESGSDAIFQERVERLEKRSQALALGLAENAKGQRRAELDSATFEQLEQSLKGKIYGGQVVNTKELMALEKDLEAAVHRRSALDDEILHCMDFEETKHKEAEGLAADLLEAREGLAEALEDARERAEILTARCNDLSAQRLLLTGVLGKDLTEEYARLRQRNGKALARPRGSACLGCHMALSEAVMRVVRHRDLVRCTNCGSFLFDPSARI